MRIHGRRDLDQDRDPGMKLLAKPSWEKEVLPQSVIPRDGTQQGMLQVTPVLALRPRDRGGSGDTWRNRSSQAQRARAGLGGTKAPRTRGESLPLMGAGAGLEKAWRLLQGKGGGGGHDQEGLDPGA